MAVDWWGGPKVSHLVVGQVVEEMDATVESIRGHG